MTTDTNTPPASQAQRDLVALVIEAWVDNRAEDPDVDMANDPMTDDIDTAIEALRHDVGTVDLSPTVWQSVADVVAGYVGLDDIYDAPEGAILDAATALGLGVTS